MSELKDSFGYTNPNITLDCHAGCHSVKINHFPKEDDYYIEFFANLFYSEQKTWIDRTLWKIKFIWNIITRSQFAFFDMGVSRNELLTFNKKLTKFLDEDKPTIKPMTQGVP